MKHLRGTGGCPQLGGEEAGRGTGSAQFSGSCHRGAKTQLPVHRSFNACLSYLALSSWKRASLVAQLVKNLPAMGSIPRLRRSPGEGKGYPLQYSGLENSMGSQRGGPTERLSLHFASLPEKNGRKCSLRLGIKFNSL